MTMLVSADNPEQVLAHCFAFTSPDLYKLPFLLLRNVTPPTFAFFGVD